MSTHKSSTKKAPKSTHKKNASTREKKKVRGGEMVDVSINGGPPFSISNSNPNWLSILENDFTGSRISITPGSSALPPPGPSPINGGRDL